MLVKTEQGSHLLDPTRGAGKIINGKFERNENPLIWFDVHPSWFIFTHFPSKQQYRLTEQSISEPVFVRLPFATSDLEIIGWTADNALSSALSKSLGFPVILPNIPVDISFLSVPNSFFLRQNTVLRLKVFLRMNLYVCKMSSVIFVKERITGKETHKHSSSLQNLKESLSFVSLVPMDSFQNYNHYYCIWYNRNLLSRRKRTQDQKRAGYHVGRTTT